MVWGHPNFRKHPKSQLHLSFVLAFSVNEIPKHAQNHDACPWSTQLAQALLDELHTLISTRDPTSKLLVRRP